ncbi:MAG: OB-fold domain-containing protein, partial [Chloroflexi bacterium]|nr:OB-fold domain-containing protein [Chloroflexota bacterium]
LGKDNPYVSGVVCTDEGPGISCRLLGLDGKKPETIKVGTPVQLDIQERTEGQGKVYSLAFRA